MIEGKLAGPAPSRCPDSEAGRQVPGRGCGPDARDRPPLQPGDGRFQRDLGRADRPLGRPGHRPLRRHRARRHGRSLLAFHQRLHARPQRQPDRSPQPARHLRAALQQADSPGRRARSSISRSMFPRARRARSRSRPRSTTASSTGPISTTSSARGRGPKLPVVVMARDQVSLAGRRADRRPPTIPRRSRRHGSAGMTMASASCSKGRPREARRAS